MPSWIESYAFSKRAEKAWHQFLSEYFGESLLQIDGKSQLSQIWNLVFENKTLRAEIKTRKTWAYEQFQKDRLVAIEVMGNVERRDLGSSIHSSASDAICYGFFTGSKIQSPMIIDRARLSAYVKCNHGKLKRNRTKTDNSYST